MVLVLILEVLVVVDCERRSTVSAISGFHPNNRQSVSAVIEYSVPVSSSLSLLIIGRVYLRLLNTQYLYQVLRLFSQSTLGRGVAHRVFLGMFFVLPCETNFHLTLCVSNGGTCAIVCDRPHVPSCHSLGFRV